MTASSAVPVSKLLHVRVCVFWGFVLELQLHEVCSSCADRAPDVHPDNKPPERRWIVSDGDVCSTSGFNNFCASGRSRN